MGVVVSTIRRCVTSCCNKNAADPATPEFPRSGNVNPQFTNILKAETPNKRTTQIGFSQSSDESNAGNPKGFAASGPGVIQPQPKVSRYTPEPSCKQVPKAKPRARKEPTKPRAVSTNTRFTKVVAFYDYSSRCHDELTFKKGDVMEIDEDGLPQHDTWIDATLLVPPYTKGKIPSNYVVEYNPLSEYQWYYGNITRKDAERLLLTAQNEDYSFLVRLCSKPEIPYSLSVRRGDKVGHYLIKISDRELFYIQLNAEFKTLPQLIQFYLTSSQAAIVLKEPCQIKAAPQTAGLSCDLADKWELDRSFLKLFEKLGKGNFGEVFRGIWNNRTDVAVKMLKNETNGSEDFLRESGALKMLHHPNVVQLYGVCTDQEPFYLVTEFMVNGDLKKYLQKGPGQQLRVEKLIDIGVQVCSGMAYLETQGFVHRDLAARNILVGNDDVYKVADFGMAALMEGEYYIPSNNNFARAVRWTAPEVFEMCKFSNKSDVWSFGICLFEIIEKGANPYRDCVQNPQVMTRVMRGEVMDKTSMPNCPRKLYNIMTRCWAFQPTDRPNFVQLLAILSSFWGSAYTDEDENFTDLNENKSSNRTTLVLDEGGFGIVTKESNDDEEVLLRKIEFEIIDEKSFHEICAVMSSLSHPRLVKVLGAYFDDEGVASITSEPMHYCTLHHAVLEGRDLTVAESTQLAAQVASGMSYLEAKNFVHGNLAARNVFIDENNKCKIADYGLRELAKCFKFPIVPFTKSLKWTAPEVLRNEEKFTIKSDVWAFGICLFEIIEKGKEPYGGLSDHDAAEAVSKGHRISFEEMEYCTGKFFATMIKCWNEDVSQRPSFAQLTETLQDLYH